MVRVPIIQEAVAGGILALGRDSDSVPKDDILQPEFLKQSRLVRFLQFFAWNSGILGFGFQRITARRVLPILDRVRR